MLAAYQHILNDRLSRLRDAGYTIAYANRTDAIETGYISPYRVHAKSYMDDNLSEYVELSGVCRGEDSYDQSSTLDRSNQRSLMRDYPDVPWCPVSYSNVDV